MKKSSPIEDTRFPFPNKTGRLWQAIFLDFDGVVVESADIKTEAYRELFVGESATLVRRILRYHARNMGVSRQVKFSHIFKSILRRPLTPPDRAKLGKRFSQLVKEEVIDCPLVRGASRFLERWRRGVDVYVVSGTPQSELRNIISRRGLGKFFRGIYGSPRTKAEIVRKVLRVKKYDPRRVVFVGDAMTDLQAAAQTSIPFVGRAPRSRCFHPHRPPVVRDLNALNTWLTSARGAGPWIPGGTHGRR